MSLIPKKKATKSNTLDRTVMEDRYAFTIYDTPINVTENDTVIAYNLLIQSDTLKRGDYFENLVINVNKATDRISAFIVKFNLTSEITQTAHESFYFEAKTDIYGIVYNNQPNPASKQSTICFRYYYTTCTNDGGGHPGGEHIAGDKCINSSYLHNNSIESCTVSESEPYNDPTNAPGNGHITQNPNGSYGGGGVLSTPTSPAPLNAVKVFVANLSPAQLQWWNHISNNRAVRDITKFLMANHNFEDVDFAMEMVTAGINHTAVSFSPFFKYPISNNYETVYPHFTSLVKDLSDPYFTGNTNLTGHIHNLTGVAIEQIKNDLKWGSGAEIRIEQLGINPLNGQEIKGKFDPESPNVIYIDVDLVNLYESTYTNPQASGPLEALIIYSVILHELVHYEDYQFDEIMTNNVELGLYFEELFSGGYYEFNPNGDGSIIFVHP